ncbi:membrane protein insertion efficiency factor YidD [Candidatus Omnitrophota bacterium]
MIIKIIAFYHSSLSPLLGNHCRFHPTCSQYFQEAIVAHGLFRGMLKGLSRLLRCHPLSGGGFDPVAK